MVQAKAQKKKTCLKDNVLRMTLSTQKRTGMCPNSEQGVNVEHLQKHAFPYLDRSFIDLVH